MTADKHSQAHARAHTRDCAHTDIHTHTHSQGVKTGSADSRKLKDKHQNNSTELPESASANSDMEYLPEANISICALSDNMCACQ